MSPTFLKGMTPRIASGAQGLVNYWKDKMAMVRQKGGNCFDVLLDLQMGTMDAIAQIAFADHNNGIQDAHDIIHISEPKIDSYGGATYPSIKGSVLHQAVDHHFHILNTAFGVPGPLLSTWWMIYKLSPTFRRHDKVIRDSIKGRIDQARARAADADKTGGSEAADCMLDMIMEKDVKEGGQHFTEKELMDEMTTQLFAGYDTTSAGLAYGIKFLMNNPRVQLKLHEELTSNLSEPENRALTYDEIATGEKTPYLEAVVNEILRCAFVGGGMGRQTQEDLVILGKVIPKGTDVMFLTGMAGMYATKNWAASRDHSDQLKPTKGLWDDEGASDFIPERWLVDGPDGEKVFSSTVGYSIPFGLGPKACFGQKLAQLEMKIFLATLNLAFYLDKVPQELNGNAIVEVITTKPKQCYVNLVDWEDYYWRN
ncbi:hypothetical protein FRC03_012677 [Tulasnella sp. 419]|nr:hypothetical protein FRC03_012677 [Tulasnella sp. 419]